MFINGCSDFFPLFKWYVSHQSVYFKLKVENKNCPHMFSNYMYRAALVENWSDIDLET